MTLGAPDMGAAGARLALFPVEELVFLARSGVFLVQPLETVEGVDLAFRGLYDDTGQDG